MTTFKSTVGLNVHADDDSKRGPAYSAALISAFIDKLVGDDYATYQRLSQVDIINYGVYGFSESLSYTSYLYYSILINLVRQKKWDLCLSIIQEKKHKHVTDVKLWKEDLYISSLLLTNLKDLNMELLPALYASGVVMFRPMDVESHSKDTMLSIYNKVKYIEPLGIALNMLWVASHSLGPDELLQSLLKANVDEFKRALADNKECNLLFLGYTYIQPELFLSLLYYCLDKLQAYDYVVDAMLKIAAVRATVDRNIIYNLLRFQGYNLDACTESYSAMCILLLLLRRITKNVGDLKQDVIELKQRLRKHKFNKLHTILSGLSTCAKSSVHVQLGAVETLLKFTKAGYDICLSN